MATVSQVVAISTSCADGGPDPAGGSGLGGTADAPAASAQEQPEQPGPDGATSAAARSAVGAKLRRCGGCLAVMYCSEECQRRDWPRHAPLCRELRGAAAGAGARGEVT